MQRVTGSPCLKMAPTQYCLFTFMSTATARASSLIHTLTTLLAEPRFNGLLILEWWHCELTGSSLLSFVSFVISVSGGRSVRDFVHPRGNYIFFCFCLQSLISELGACITNFTAVISSV